MITKYHTRIDSLPDDLRAIANDMLEEKFGKRRVYDAWSPEWERAEKVFTGVTQPNKVSTSLTTESMQAAIDEMRKIAPQEGGSHYLIMDHMINGTMQYFYANTGAYA